MDNKESDLCRPILIRDRLAITLARKRATQERRSGANAAAITIIEALSEHNQTDAQHTGRRRPWQEEIIEKSLPDNPAEGA